MGNASSHIYWVKLEKSLFRKPEWSITLNGQKIGLHMDRDEAVSSAVAEAGRTSILGRTSEIWIDEGLGFTLHKSIKATKPDVPDDDEEGEKGDDFDLDENSLL